MWPWSGRSRSNPVSTILKVCLTALNANSSLINPPPWNGEVIIGMPPSFIHRPSITFSCSLHISWTLWKFSKPWSNALLSETVNRTHDSTTQIQSQRSKYREGIIGIPSSIHRPSITHSCPLHISWALWKFSKLWSNALLSETVYRTHDSTTQTQSQHNKYR